MKKLLSFLFCLFITSCCAYQYDLSICTIFRDEAPYLKEWIEYHRLLGVQHFYLCNHNSLDNYNEVLDHYIKEGIVELKEISDSPKADLADFTFNFQTKWYTECLVKAKDQSKWVAFLDSDEFLCLLDGNNLVDFLKNYEEFGGVSLNWFFFGTSNIQQLCPNKLMIEQLTCCSLHSNENFTLLKCIVQPRYVSQFRSPHFADFLPGYFAVNTNQEPLLNEPWKGVLLFDKLRINHYWTREEEYFWKVKIPRQIQLHGQTETAMSFYVDFNKSENFDIQKFVPELRKKMGYDKK